MSLDHLVVSRRNKTDRKKKKSEEKKIKRKKEKSDGDTLKEHGSQLESQVSDHLSTKIIAVMDPILLDKIRLGEPILIEAIGEEQESSLELKPADARLLNNKIFL